MASTQQPGTPERTHAGTREERPLRRLVVLAPALHSRGANWQQLRERLEQEPEYSPSEAEWFIFEHGTKSWTLGTVNALAHRLRDLIEQLWVERGGFDDIVLVGHSMGGVIVRQAYLLAAGGVPGEPRSPWAPYVSRMVLFAAMNRGFDPKQRMWLRFVTWGAQAFPLPHLRTEDIVRGSDFLTNLRINWIRHMGALTASELNGVTGPDGRSLTPYVVQLLGSNDGLVTKEDSRDVLAFPNAREIRVPDADHKMVYRLDKAPNPNGRYALIRQAFVEHPPQRTGVSPEPARPAKERVIFLLHGIRAANVDEWIQELARRIEARDPEATLVVHPTYLYFTAMRFALPGVRRRNIRVFQDWYTEALADHPTADFSIIAHSNGTYMLGQSLLCTPGMRFRNVVLAGSVLPQDYPWDEMTSPAGRNQVGRVRNERANRDWPVALLCNGLRGLFMRDVGTGGFGGFKGAAVDEFAYYVGDHGAALHPDNLDRLVDYVLDGEAKGPEALISDPGLYRQLSNLMPYLAPLLVVLVLVGVGWWVAAGGADAGVRGLTAAGVILGLYVLLDVI